MRHNRNAGKTLVNLTWAFALLCVSVLIAELWAREKFADTRTFNGVSDLRLPSELLKPDPLLGYQFVPNATHFFSSANGEFKVNYHINEIGLRDSGMLSSGPKRPLVLTLGGATVEGYGVMRDASFTLEMQRQLRFQKGAITYPRILGAGMTGYGAVQNYLLGKKLTKELQPDVILFLYSSLMPVADFRFLRGARLGEDGMAVSASQDFALPTNPTMQSNILEKIKLFQLLNNYLTLKKSVAAIRPGDPDTDIFAAARDGADANTTLHHESLKYVMALAEFANSNGVDFAFVYFPLPHQVAADEWSTGRYRHKFEARVYDTPDTSLFDPLCSKAHVSCFDTTGMLRNLASERSSRVFFEYDYALTDVGHRALVQFLINPVRELLGHPIPANQVTR
ncbi:MAG: hypothetical protein ACU84Q_11830 [Gammaproteobacteria bacterium]